MVGDLCPPPLSGAGSMPLGRADPTFAILLAGCVAHFMPDSISSDSEAWFKRPSPLVWVGGALAVGAAAMQLGTGDQLAFVCDPF